MAVAKAIGASRIIAVDILQSRLDFAKKYAATDVFRPPQLQEGEPVTVYSQRAADLLRTDLGVEDRGEKAIDVVIDASGAEVSIQTGILIAKVGGTFVQGSLALCYAISSLPITGWHGSPRSGRTHHYFARKGAGPQRLLPLWRTYFLRMYLIVTDIT